MNVWEFTDDPSDPCGYCIVWLESDDPVKAAVGEDARPVWPDGQTVEHIYRYVHMACNRSVAAYVASTVE